MISSQYRFIYLHYPKTGGNSLQTILLPFSDDRKVVKAHQDGAHRFEVAGKTTPEKHATLQDYHDRLGDRLADYRVVISVRHPFERFVSAYYSPHRWFRQDDAGDWTAITPFWDEAQCMRLLEVRYQKPVTEYLRVNGTIRHPDLVVRYETYAEDLRRMVRALELPVDATDLELPHVNASAASRELRRQALDDRALQRRIEDFYRADMDYFGYGPFRPKG